MFYTAAGSRWNRALRSDAHSLRTEDKGEEGVCVQQSARDRNTSGTSWALRPEVFHLNVNRPHSGETSLIKRPNKVVQTTQLEDNNSNNLLKYNFVKPVTNKKEQHASLSSSFLNKHNMFWHVMIIIEHKERGPTLAACGWLQDPLPCRCPCSQNCNQLLQMYYFTLGSYFISTSFYSV